MFITLTNANPSHKNKTIVLNVNSIVSVHRNIANREDGTIEEVTFIHCPPHGTWEVVEPLEKVLSLLNNEKPRKKA